MGRPELEREINRRQYFSLIFIAMLSPITRQFPYFAGKYGGVSGIYSVILAGVFAALYLIIIVYLTKDRFPREGLGEIFIRGLGKPLGFALLFFCFLWVSFYNAYMLRAGVDRIVSTIFPDIHPYTFFFIMILALIPTVLGELNALGRLACFFRPILILPFVAIVFFVLPDADYSGLFSLKGFNLASQAQGGFSLLGVCSTVLMLGFLGDRYKIEKKSGRGVIILCFLGVFALAFLLVMSVLSCFGAELSAKLSHPFFAMVRNITISGHIERMESLIAGLWIAIDYIHASALLLVSTKILCLLFKKANRALSGVISVGLVSAFGVFLGKSSFRLKDIGRGLIHNGNIILFVGIIPLVLIICKIRAAFKNKA
ncbi:GerAB/ArcD/ProY family transporter [Clostridiaceae bacterium OttesenSCG-928-D20]|nr:GerAB/ArcD/ProY family transporter [Clostridiaceae bacterium OttesenSCG-928-D20]